jgi:3-oxoacyl-[acyl-carrier-protein] synthase II
MGLVAPGTSTVDAFWSALVNGRSLISALPPGLGDDMPVHAAAYVDDFEFLPSGSSFVRRPRGRLPLFGQFAFASAAGAVESADLDLSVIDPARLGVVVGNGSGGMPHIGPHIKNLWERGWDRVDPQALVQLLPNVVVGHLASAFGARGYNATFVAACASSTQAIGEAARAVRSGLADVVITGGTEAWITEAGLCSFAVLNALSSWDGDPRAASRPFDRDRSGFVPAEGAAMLVIEERDAAISRGAPILAEVRGYASTNDAHHLVAPDPAGRGAAEAISLALADAGLAPGDVDHVNAHGTGTVRGDVAETRALKTALGDHAYGVPVSATKSLIGHAMGASGALEVVACVQTLRTGTVHPTINLDVPDSLCDLDYVRCEARAVSARTVLKNSFGFGGHNACLVIGAAD